MSLYRRGQVYWYEFVSQGIRFRGSTGATEREAAKLAESRARIAARESAAPPGRRPAMTLGGAAERYYQEVAAHQPSAVTTDGQLETLVRLLGADTPLAAIGDARIADFVARRRAEKSRNAPRGHKPSCRCDHCALAPATVNREIELLRRLMRRAAKAWKAEVGEMPDWSVHLLPEAAERIRELTTEEQEALLAALRPDLKPMVLFCLATGVRKDDAVTLTWRQVDMTARVVRLSVKSRRPGGQPHIIPITNEVAAILQNERGHNPVRVFTYVCARSRGKRRKGERYPFAKGALAKEWHAALASAGVEDFRFHDLRHTAATRLLRASGNLRLVQKLLGHTDIATTARYAHADLDDLRAALEAVAAPSPLRAAESPHEPPHGRRDARKR